MRNRQCFWFLGLSSLGSITKFLKASQSIWEITAAPWHSHLRGLGSDGLVSERDPWSERRGQATWAGPLATQHDHRRGPRGQLGKLSRPGTAHRDLVSGVVPEAVGPRRRALNGE